MLIINLQPNLNFQIYNYPIWLPNAASGDLRNQKWNQILSAVTT